MLVCDEKTPGPPLALERVPPRRCLPRSYVSAGLVFYEPLLYPLNVMSPAG